MSGSFSGVSILRDQIISEAEILLPPLWANLVGSPWKVTDWAFTLDREGLREWQWACLSFLSHQCHLAPVSKANALLALNLLVHGPGSFLELLINLHNLRKQKMENVLELIVVLILSSGIQHFTRVPQKEDLILKQYICRRYICIEIGEGYLEGKGGYIV